MSVTEHHEFIGCLFGNTVYDTDQNFNLYNFLILFNYIWYFVNHIVCVIDPYKVDLANKWAAHEESLFVSEERGIFIYTKR